MMHSKESMGLWVGRQREEINQEQERRKRERYRHRNNARAHTNTPKKEAAEKKGQKGEGKTSSRVKSHMLDRKGIERSLKR